jgi:KipI family sensor histidine kinase inhibitor
VSSEIFSVVALGEGAWTIVLGDAVSPAVHARVTAAAARISAAALPGIIEIVPAYAALTVFFDARATDAEAFRVRLSDLAQPESGLPDSVLTTSPSSSPLLTIPVRYDGPDLDEVAATLGVPRAEVIRRHAEREYLVYLLGFAPGFAYLGDLDPLLVLPRRRTPRTRVPAGSVAIAGAQTAVYPLVTPGGWHVIGTTPLRMFDPARNPAALLKAGNRVRFEPLP